jgi:DNA-binding transcriptional LysR family regulator
VCKNAQMFDWDDLRIFMVLAHSGSLASAARALRVNHVTVGRRVAGLEQSLGVRLVDRLARSTPLTEQGKRIAALGEAMEDTARKIERIARGASASLEGTVSVSAPPAIASTFIAERLGALRAAHPGLLVSLQGMKTLASLEHGEADIAVRLVRPEHPAHVMRRLGMLWFGLYAAPAIAAQAAEDWTFVGYDEALEHLPQQRWLEAYAGSRAMALRVSDVAGQLAAVRAGIGVGLLPGFMAEGDARLVRVDPQSQPEPREIWLVVHEDIRRAPAVRAAADHLVDMFRSEPAFQNRPQH